MIIEVMLETEKPDCAYIATTPNFHYELTMMCLRRRVPVICEKAMFLNSTDAKSAFDLSKELNVFCMEALWSRFLPAVNKTRSWLEEKKIGDVSYLDAKIGFIPQQDNNNRYFNPLLGGGAMYDITVYTDELITYLIPDSIRKIGISALWSKEGVDIEEHICFKYDKLIASMTTSFITDLSDSLVLYGNKGKIVLPQPHYAKRALLYDNNDILIEEYQDQKTVNGFVYEIQECINCIRKGRYASKIVPHSSTMQCSELFDIIRSSRDLKTDCL